jgi:hypothetical protein
MKKSIIAMSAALALAASLQPADAFFRGGGGFGGFHGGFGGGFAHGTYAGPRGVAHVGDAGGFWHGTAVGRGGAVHAGDYGGYYHSTAVGAGGVYHTTGYGAYYHQPVVVNSYGASCLNCGAVGWGGGAVAAGAIAGAALASAAAASAWPVGTTYGYLPSGCAYTYAAGQAYYRCADGWLRPAYGANGLYYRVVAAP